MCPQSLVPARYRPKAFKLLKSDCLGSRILRASSLTLYLMSGLSCAKKIPEPTQAYVALSFSFNKVSGFKSSSLPGTGLGLALSSPSCCKIARMCLSFGFVMIAFSPLVFFLHKNSDVTEFPSLRYSISPICSLHPFAGNCTVSNYFFRTAYVEIVNVTYKHNSCLGASVHTSVQLSSGKLVLAAWQASSDNFLQTVSVLSRC